MKLIAPLAAPMLALAVMAFAVAAHAQAPAQPPALKTTEVKPGLFMIVGDGGNVAVRVAPVGLLVVDSKNPGDAIFGRLTTAIRAISPASNPAWLNPLRHRRQR